ncbi:MAG: hypothetical protein HY530_06875 [Chloroflexi bacterium]|nr:hypothetical protein [Chloroflexota bacterium]
MNAEEEIKQFALQKGADAAGIASVADINHYAPPGHRPDDILIGAKSVVVLAGYSAFQGAWHSPDHRTHYYNRDFPRIRLSAAAAVSRLIESRYGYYSLAETPPSLGFNPCLSHKLCAEMAGLGTRSLAAAMVLNPKLGMPSFSICITTMPLKADGPMTEPVCPHPSCVKLWEKHRTTPCLDICPECLSGEIEGERIKWMRYDRRICTTRAQTESASSWLRTLLEAANEPDPGVRKNIFLGSSSRLNMAAITSGAVFGQCGWCLINCPVCMQARTLKAIEPTSTTAEDSH